MDYAYGPPRFWRTRQPFKTLYITIYVLSLAARLPLWLISAIFFRPRKSWSIKAALVVRLVRHFGPLIARARLSLARDLLVQPKTGSLKRTKYVHAKAVEESRIGDGFAKEMARHNHVKAVDTPCFFWSRQNEGGVKAKGQDMLAIYFHGGAYSVQTAHESDPTSGKIPLGLLKHSKISKVLSVDYRLVGQPGPFPSALFDALTAYIHAVETLGYDAGRVMLVGDSAGGNLTLALLRHLHDTQTAPLPAAVVLFSPWTDLTLPKGGSAARNRESDLVGRELGLYATSLFFKDLPSSARQTAYCSPGAKALDEKATFDGFPPTLVIAGDAEILFDEVKLVYDRLKAAGNDATFYVGKDMPHDWCLFDDLFPGEARDMLNKVGQWCNERLQNSE